MGEYRGPEYSSQLEQAPKARVRDRASKHIAHRATVGSGNTGAVVEQQDNYTWGGTLGHYDCDYGSYTIWMTPTGSHVNAVPIRSYVRPHLDEHEHNGCGVLHLWSLVLVQLWLRALGHAGIHRHDIQFLERWSTCGRD